VALTGFIVVFGEKGDWHMGATGGIWLANVVWVARFCVHKSYGLEATGLSVLQCFIRISEL